LSILVQPSMIVFTLIYWLKLRVREEVDQEYVSMRVLFYCFCQLVYAYTIGWVLCSCSTDFKLGLRKDNNRPSKKYA